MFKNTCCDDTIILFSLFVLSTFTFKELMDAVPEVSIPVEILFVERFCTSKDGILNTPVEILFVDNEPVTNDVPVIGTFTIRPNVLRFWNIPVILSIDFVEILETFKVEMFTTFSIVFVVDIVVAEIYCTVRKFVVIL